MKQIIKFYADWCGPCHVMSPVVDEVSKEYDVPVRTVDIDKESEMAQAYGVRSIPTVILLEDQREVARVVGAVPKYKLASELKLT